MKWLWKPSVRPSQTELPIDIMSAATVSNWPGVLRALNSGADPNVTGKDGRAPIHYAIVDGQIEAFTSLLQAGANINIADKQGWTPLHAAAHCNCDDMARLLIEAGADVKAEDAWGNTPLFRATFGSKGRGDMIRLLLSAGADRNRTNKSGVSPLSLANSMANRDIAQFFNDEVGP